METKAIEESPGVVSMMRWVLRITTFTYIGVVVVITGFWLYDAITGEPNWTFGLGVIVATGALKGVSELFKVWQKKHEVKGEIEELKTMAKDG